MVVQVQQRQAYVQACRLSSRPLWVISLFGGGAWLIWGLGLPRLPSVSLMPQTWLRPFVRLSRIRGYVSAPLPWAKKFVQKMA